MDALHEIDEALERLTDLVAEVRAKAADDDCDHMSMDCEWPVTAGDGVRVKVWLSRIGGSRELITAPTAVEAYAEALRRINWQRDVNMKRIAP
jgi:hypothetical protein